MFEFFSDIPYLLFADLAGQRSIPSSNVVEETLVDEVMTRTSCPSEIRLFLRTLIKLDIPLRYGKYISLKIAIFTKITYS